MNNKPGMYIPDFFFLTCSFSILHPYRGKHLTLNTTDVVEAKLQVCELSLVHICVVWGFFFFLFESRSPV